MQRVAIYPGTFDPITNGHVNLIERAAKLFDTLLVAVAVSARKTPCFSLEEREDMCVEILKSFTNVKVVHFAGLLIDFAKSMQAEIIIRGLRAVSDFDYEFQLAGMNRQMAPKIETVFLPATEDNTYISATMVREIVSLGGDASPFVHPYVIEKLKSR
jgi:pantetheine-phosphate adenylyltransferase